MPPDDRKPTPKFEPEVAEARARAGHWTPKQATDAMVAMKIDGSTTWAEQAFLACEHAAASAPAGQGRAWVNTVVRSFAEDMIASSIRMADDLDATEAQRLALIQGRAASFDRRLAELLPMAGPHHGSA